NFNIDGKAFDGTDWQGRKEGQPFFAQVNLSMTHRTFKRDKENPVDPAKVELPPYYPDHPLARRDWADYLESLQVLDSQIGQVLKRLEDDGVADNTIVFYFGDHGRPHVRGKQWLYEGGIRIPMIIRMPARMGAGKVMDNMISSIDIAPTSLAMARIDVPKHMQGKVFGGPNWQKRDYIVSARDRCDETVDRIRCVRTKQYKYIRNYYPERPYTQMNCYKKQAYPMLSLMEALNEDGKLTDAQAKFMAATRPKEELYDLVKDPYEINNLAGVKEHAEMLKDLSEKLDKWVVETGDKGEKPEDEKETKYWSDFFSKRYAKLMKSRGLGENPSAKARLEWWENKMLSGRN
ncbi:MAG: sulfatase, partial [Anaerohalosphaera sp.]|nr:sulfatase [Anaerohalosphaera sp.]